MAEPTLKDVLDVVTKLDAKIESTRTELSATRTELSAKIDTVRAEVVTVRAELATVRGEMRAGFDALDKELSGHADPTHRKLEERVAALERMARKPAARTAARPARRR